jgi:hypothetical protein
MFAAFQAPDANQSRWHSAIHESLSAPKIIRT